jgi:hypothetical protein
MRLNCQWKAGGKCSSLSPSRRRNCCLRTDRTDVVKPLRSFNGDLRKKETSTRSQLTVYWMWPSGFAFKSRGTTDCEKGKGGHSRMHCSVDCQNKESMMGYRDLVSFG